ncbi:hypothetical protein KRX54_06570 [Actinomycetaceae bacterium TAE3-ERU4]|nr:hypothetical protein [Actinomycetaceae bacterium TAE3-ERU4]
MSRLAPREWKLSPRPLVVAHRGGAELGLQNSLLTMQNASQMGVDVIETDVRATKDGVAVLLHDPNLYAVCGRLDLLSSLTWEEASKIELKDGSRLVRLDDMLQAFPEMVFNIDAKENAVVDSLVKAIISGGAQDRVCIASFSHRRMLRIRSLFAGKVATSLSPFEILRALSGTYFLGKIRDEEDALVVDKAERSRLRRLILGREDESVVAAQVPLRFKDRIPVVGDRFNSFVHAADFQVQAWTINEAAELDSLLNADSSRAKRVDAVITDAPDIALSLRP